MVCPHPWDEQGRVCDPNRAEPPEPWPLEVWCCWLNASKLADPRYRGPARISREAPTFAVHRSPPPPPKALNPLVSPAKLSLSLGKLPACHSQTF